jgi:hypothetical protein
MMKNIMILGTMFLALFANSQISFNVNSPQSSGNLKVGDAHLGGTIVYFFKQGDANYGKYTGIVAADSYLTEKQWGCSGKLVNNDFANSGKIGNAVVNHSKLIASNCPGSAAALCESLEINGQKGWILPTSNDLVEVFKGLWILNRPVYAGVYWTSADANVNDAMIIQGQIMGDRSLKPQFTTRKKTFTANVYPIKYF